MDKGELRVWPWGGLQAVHEALFNAVQDGHGPLKQEGMLGEELLRPDGILRHAFGAFVHLREGGVSIELITFTLLHGFQGIHESHQLNSYTTRKCIPPRKLAERYSRFKSTPKGTVHQVTFRCPRSPIASMLAPSSACRQNIVHGISRGVL